MCVCLMQMRIIYSLRVYDLFANKIFLAKKKEEFW